MTIQTIVLVGDSLTAGNAGMSDMGEGGKGSWAEFLTERLANLPTLGPLVSSGMRNLTIPEVFRSAAWTRILPSSLDQKAPYNQSYKGTTIADTITYTLPVAYRRPVGFAIYWTDHATSGNWQYRVDGGTWTNMGQTLAHDHSLNKFYVNTPVTATLDVRAFNGTTDCEAILVGFEMFWQNPTTASGLIVHNIGIGGTLLDNIAAPQTGDAMAFLDSIKLAAGTPSSAATLFTTVMHINDVSVLNNTTTWATDLTLFHGRAKANGPVIFMSPWECLGVAADQASYRAQTKTTAAGLTPVPRVFDFYDEWSGKGIVSSADTLAIGYTLEGTHPTQVGHFDIGERLYWLIRAKYASTVVPNLGTVSVNPFVAGQSQAGGIQTLGDLPDVVASETGTGTDAGEALALTNADSGAGTDAGETLALADVDSAAGTDSGESIAVVLTDADTGSGSDGGEALALTHADTGAGTDAGESLTATIADADTGAGVDAGESLALAHADTAAGTDAGEALALLDAELGSGTDAGEALALIDGDMGGGAEAESVLSPGVVTDTDVGTFTDAGESIAALLTDADTATGTDAESIAAAVSDADAGAFSEAVTTIAVTITDADVFSSSEAGTVDTGGGSGRDLVIQFGGVRDKWHFGSARDKWLFGAGR